jgi:hypothetical protein
MGPAFSDISDMMGALGSMGGGFNTFEQMIDNEDLIHSQYELVGDDSEWADDPTEIMLVLDKNNAISNMVLYMLGIKDQLSGTYFYDTGRKEYSMEFMGSDVVIQIADEYSGVTTYYCTYEITTDRYGDPIMTITDTNTILGKCPLAGNQSYEEGKGYFILAGARFEKK